jgi:hypothetical protein
MSVNNFIPEIWSGRVFQSLRKAHVFGDVVNRDYEGEISQAGDTVHINSLGPITIAAYTKNSTSITPETLADTDMMLKIDQADYFAFQVDNIDKRQAQADILSAGMDIAADGLADTSDHYSPHQRFSVRPMCRWKAAGQFCPRGTSPNSVWPKSCYLLRSMALAGLMARWHGWRGSMCASATT